MRTILTICCAAAFFAAAPARAGLIVDQSPPNGNALDMTDYRVADDFTLTATYNIDSVSFWYFAQDQTDLSNLTFGIYYDAGGSLGTLVDTGTITPTTSFDSNNDAFFAVADISDTLGAGTYWIELHAGTSFTDDNGSLEVDWATASGTPEYDALYNLADGVPDTSSTIDGYTEMTLQIDGTLNTDGNPPSSPTPEPAAAWLAVAPLAAFIGFSLRRRRSR